MDVILWFIHVVALACFFIPYVGAQVSTTTIPSTWRKPTLNLSLAERNNLTRAVADPMALLFNSTSGIADVLGFTDTGSLLSSLSLLDRINNTALFKNVVLNSIYTVFDRLRGPTFSYETNSNTALWGVAAANAAITYRDPTSLEFAKTAWEQLDSTYLVRPADVNGTNGVRYNPTRSIPFASSCNGSTTAGGVFFISGKNQNNTDVNTETVATFMTLSSYLYELTSNKSYLSTAELSADFIWHHLYNGTIILDTISLEDCSIKTFALSYNSGKVMEGLSSLAVQKSGWGPRLNSLVATTVPFAFWTGSDGINKEDSGESVQQELTPNFLHSLKAFFIRGLYAAWNFTGPGSDIAPFIEGYINVQFNALQDLATFPGSSEYSSSWLGPPIPESVPWGQLDALEVFRAAVGLAAPTTTTVTGPLTEPGPTVTPGSSSTPATAVTSRSKSRAGAIAGGVVGGLTFLLIVLLGYFVWMRKREKARMQHADDQLPHMEEVATCRDTHADIVAVPTTFHTPASDPQIPETTGRLRDMFRLSLYKPRAYLTFESTAAASNDAAHEDQAQAFEDGGGTPPAHSPEPMIDDPSNQVDLVAINRRLNQILTRLNRREVRVERRPTVPSDFELS